jgi:hypothetical protein
MPRRVTVLIEAWSVGTMFFWGWGVNLMGLHDTGTSSSKITGIHGATRHGLGLGMTKSGNEARAAQRSPAPDAPAQAVVSPVPVFLPSSIYSLAPAEGRIHKDLGERVQSGVGNHVFHRHPGQVQRVRQDRPLHRPPHGRRRHLPQDMLQMQPLQGNLVGNVNLRSLI